MKKTKVFAAYLPQYHEIEENNKFWGKGFTDWKGVKEAKAQFSGHNQPRIPLKHNYYDLSDYNIIKWQAELAKKYGITGFNIYHYWFENGHKVLEKPAESLLEHPEINIEYFFSWDNTSWIRSWSNIVGNTWAPKYDKEEQEQSPYLLKLDYGGENEWAKHFEYLLPFFKDKRYLKMDGRPVFALMRNSNEEILKNMRTLWNKLAIENGLNGVYLITGCKVFLNKKTLDGQFLYEPRISAWGKREAIEGRIRKFLKMKNRKGLQKYDYKTVWKKIIRNAKKNAENDLILGSVVRFDDTPRRGKNARILANDSPEVFEKYFKQFYKLCCENNKNILLLTAWNEWGEGAYLEPDTEYEYKYLEAVRRAVESVSEKC